MKQFAAKAMEFAAEYLRGLYPFCVCMVGGSAMMAISELGVVSLIVAALSFVWAIDLASTQAAAKAKSETAAMLTAMLVSGSDTTVTVQINNT